MARASDLFVNIILTDKYSKELKKVKTNTKTAVDSMKKNWLAIGVAIAGVTTAIAGVVKTLERAQAIERAEVALEAYAGSAEEAARTTVMVQDAADGAISRFDAMQNSAKLMAMGLAGNAEEAAKLTEIALTLGASMGKGPQQAFEEFTLMLANQSIPRLDTFGISSGRVRERIIELQRATEGLTREQAFMQAVMEDAEGKLIALDAAGFESSSSLDKLKAISVDLKDSLVVTIADGLEPFLDALIKVREETRALEERAMAAATAEEYIAIKLERVQGAAVMTGDQLAQMRRHFEDVKGEAKETAIPIEILRHSLDDLAESAEAVALENLAIVDSLKEITAAELAREALQALNQAAESGLITQEEYEAGFRDIAGGMGEMSGAQIEAHLRLAELKRDFESGKTPVDRYIESLKRLEAQLKSTSSAAAGVSLPRVPSTSGGGHRQFGGPVSAGVPYWVGEAGPELFVPRRGGRVEPIRQGRDETVIEMRKIRDDISWLVEQLPPTLRDVMLQEM